MQRILFWNVDTQVDFIEPYGKLYVQGAELIKPALKTLTAFAREHNIRVVNSADYHYKNSHELSSHPDFIETFPEHCMAHTPGCDYISETSPDHPLVVGWERIYDVDEIDIDDYRNIVIQKDEFDVFDGNPNTDTILEKLNPSTVIVYGVTTNVCVDRAVLGLLDRDLNVFVVSNAIKELPNLSIPIDGWKKQGVQMITTDELPFIIPKLIG